MTRDAYIVEILNFAISKEEDSIQFYTYLAETVDKPYMKEMFKQVAGEEKGHRAKLESVKKERLLIPAAKKLWISRFLITSWTLSHILKWDTRKRSLLP